MIQMTSVEAQNQFGKLLDTAQREAVAITRHGRPAAFVVSLQEMEELLDARRRRGVAVAELEAWSADARSSVAKSSDTRSGTAAGRAGKAAQRLTDEEVNRLVHAAR